MSAEDFEQTLKHAHQLEAESAFSSNRECGALQHDDASHKQEIDALLRAADDAESVPFQYSQSDSASLTQRSSQSHVDWNDDQILMSYWLLCQIVKLQLMCINHLLKSYHQNPHNRNR